MLAPLTHRAPGRTQPETGTAARAVGLAVRVGNGWVLVRFSDPDDGFAPKRGPEQSLTSSRLPGLYLM